MKTAEGVDLKGVEGSGPAGRISKADVLAASSNGAPTAAAPSKDESATLLKGAGAMLARQQAAEAARETRPGAGLGAAEDQGMHVVGAFIGVDHLEVHQVPDHAELVDDAVAAEHVARVAGHR